MKEEVKITKKEVEEILYDPFGIGVRVLKKFGYVVKTQAVGYSGIAYKVVDEKGNVIAEDFIGG